jgi:hypothetical protein
MRGNKVMIGVIVGILGLMTAAVTNLDKIQDLWKAIFGPKGEVAINGKWLGVYREFSTGLERSREAPASDVLHLQQRGIRINGTADTPTHKGRSWDISGLVHAEWIANREGPFLVLNYTAPKEDQRASVGSCILERTDKPRPEVTEFKGYWLGHDPEVRRIMACPYVLSNDTSEQYQKPARARSDKP